MERRLAAVPPASSAHTPSTNPAAAATLNPDAVRQPGIALLGNLRLTGFVQVQYQHTDISQDQLSPTGASLNQDLFLVRRARLRLAGDWTFFSFIFEADGNTVNGPAVGLTRAEASLFWRKDALAIPYIKGTLGLTAIPFGFELQQPENELLFMERSTGSRAFFPLKQNIGAVLAGGLGIFRYQLAAMGSESSAYPNSPTANPDFLGRVGIEHTMNPDLLVAGGVSFLDGTGFSPGSNATKWIDTNENGVIDPGEIIGVPGTAARPSSTFNHWGVNVDLEVGVRTRAGWTRLYGEATLGSNLDRSLFVADPAAIGRNLREIAFLAGVTQEITKYGFVGFRADGYNPDLDSTTSERGLVLVTSQTITTLAPIIGLQLPGRARLTFEYDYVINLLGRTSAGVPTQLDDNDWILRLQGEL